MRKLTIKEKDIRNSVQKVAASCSCKYSCRGGENMSAVGDALYYGSTYGGDIPVRLNTNI